MTEPILPNASSLLSPAIDAIVALRPESRPFFSYGGNWQNLTAMWRAQVLVLLARLGDETMSARLKFATGERLRTLCASEFNTTLPPDPQPAYGTIGVSRSGTGPGVIPAGTQFVKAADPKGVPLPVAAATYVTTQTVYFAEGISGGYVNLVATSPGPAGNIPYFPAYFGAPVQPASPLFDPTFKGVSPFIAAGGSSGLTDPVLVAAAKAYAVGQFGPTDGATLAGALRQQSVRHYAAFAAGKLPYAQLFLADESWASTAAWYNRIAQEIANAWQGFGCRIRYGFVQNVQITLTATLVLQSTDDLADTSAIDANVRAAAEAYFNDRPDWYILRAASLEAVLSNADARILHCTSVGVFDAVLGTPIADTVNSFASSWTGTITHYYLTDASVTATYEPPL